MFENKLFVTVVTKKLIWKIFNAFTLFLFVYALIPTSWWEANFHSYVATHPSIHNILSYICVSVLSKS